MLTAEQIAKLPKGARDHIAVLERRITDLTQDLYEMQTEGATDTRVRMPGHRTPNLGLPKGSTVRFGSDAPHGRYIDVRMDAEGGENFRDGWVDVWATTGGQMLVIPRAANVVVVRSLYRAEIDS